MAKNPATAVAWARLTDEQRKAARSIKAAIVRQSEKSHVFGARAFLEAEDGFHNMIVEAAEKAYDAIDDATLAALPADLARVVRIVAVLRWLRASAEEG